MSAINSNWPRWIEASIKSWFKSEMETKLGSNFDVRFEAHPENPDDSKEWVECRIDGPDFDPYASNEWGLRLEINVLISVPIGDGDLYRMARVKGFVAEILSECVSLLEKGDGDAQFGTLRLESMDTRDFGRIKPHASLRQASIEVSGRTELVS